MPYRSFAILWDPICWFFILEHKPLVLCPGNIPLCPSVQDFPTFFSIRFSVSGFMWRSLIHLDLSFVEGDKNGSICILLHADRQLNQHHLLKMRSFFPLDDFVFFVKDQVTIGMWVYFWVFNSIQLMDLSVSLSIPCSYYYYCFCSTDWGQGWWFPQKFFCY